MSAHPIGSATLSFGLVSVPVKMFSTGEASAAISFNWLHKKDGARLKQQYVCSKDGDKVEKDEMVKGYEFSKGQYVIFSPEELKALEEKSTNAIEVAEFVPAKQVDRVYVEKSYFLGPDKGGERAYRLLAEALKQTGRVAVGQYAARGKPAQGRGQGDHARAGRGAQDADHRPDGSAQGEPQGQGSGGRGTEACEARREEGGGEGRRAAGGEAQGGRCAGLVRRHEGIHVPGRRQAAGVDRRAGAGIRARRFFVARPGGGAALTAVFLPGPGDPPNRQGAR